MENNVYLCDLSGLATCVHRAETDYGKQVCCYTAKACTYRKFLINPEPVPEPLPEPKQSRKQVGGHSLAA